MPGSRRAFLKNSALAAAGATFFSNELFAASKAKHLLGVQLYSVRDDMTKDPMGTLKAIAAIGYKHVEHANYIDRKFYGWSSAEFKKVLNDLDLKMPSGHTVMNKDHWDESKKDFTDKWKYTIEDAAVLGQQFVISPWLDESWRKNEDDLKRYMDVFNKSGALCKKSGMKFGYHNHDFEFSQKMGDTTVFDIILTNTDPSLVAMQLDIGNMYNAGALAADVLKKYPNRFESMHVKDEIKGTGGNERFESTILGTGVIPVLEVVKLGEKSGGTIHFIIEQESYQGKTPLESVKQDYQVMKKWGY
jgi:sugar phosphate isomerase/epimerase